MKAVLALAVLAGSALGFYTTSKRTPPVLYDRRAALQQKNKIAIGCSPDLSTVLADAPAIPLLSGWGSYRMPVTAADDSAHVFFQQGINLYYSFHIIEALASFERALQFDSSFAMAWWGKALAYGPNINDLGYTASPEALRSVQKAQLLSKGCTAFEQALIHAMQLRYTADTTQSREQLNQLYATAMKAVYQHYPAKADAAALYADALMIQHPWDLYDSHYLPKPWTPAIVQLLEQLVAKFPLHPGAAHYYIHAIEGSQHPELALPVANRLGKMMPGVSHLVHMPSHIYIRSGFYNKGIQSNIEAVKGYQEYLQKFQPVAGSVFLYQWHNLHLQTACAMMDAQYSNALQYANELTALVDTGSLSAGGYMGVFAQYMYYTPAIIQVRFGKWNELLQMPETPAGYVYGNILQTFARGMAYARTQQLAKAAAALDKIQQLSNDPQLKESPAAFNPGLAGTRVATAILAGIIAEESGDLNKAITHLNEAVQLEDNMLYNEPRDWLLPARQYLGNALLKARQYRQAEIVFREDLRINPVNAWSLKGLLLSLQHQQKNKEAVSVSNAFTKATARTNIKIEQAVF